MRSIFKFDTLYRAYYDCRKTKRNKPDALRFEMHAEDFLSQLHLELQERIYHPSTSLCFVSRKPKLREIFAADFRDRILHHLIVRTLEKIWEPVFIYDSYASRPHKGIHLAVSRLQHFTRKVTNNRTQPAYYLQLDIRNFFMSIDKNILFSLIKSRCQNEEILWSVSALLFHDPTQDYHLKSPQWLMRQIPRQKSLFGTAQDIGLPIGNLTSQFFANVYLNGLDQFIKHTLKCRFYMRYVDDLVLLNKNKDQLLSWHSLITDYLHVHLKLTLNESRTKLRPITNGIDFLGYIVRPNYVLSRNRVVNNLKAKLREYEKQLICIHEKGVMIRYDADVLEDLFASLNSYLGHFKHANTFKLKQHLFIQHHWLSHYFLCKMSKKKGFTLKRLYVTPGYFRNLRTQYLYFIKQFSQFLIFFQVGCFYEFYEKQAHKAIHYLSLKKISDKFMFKDRCGIGVKALDRYVDLALQQDIPVVVINQTGYVLTYTAERKVAIKYLPIKMFRVKEGGFPLTDLNYNETVRI